MADYADTHPRIPLNSEKDWQTIQDTITHALLQSIDAQFASEGIDPALKSYVTKQALKWRDQLAEQAIPNLRLNGMPFDKYLASTENMEPFDEALDRKIRSLAAEKELIQVQVAERRAKTPKAIHALMEDLIRRQVAGEWVPSVEDQDMAVDDERESILKQDELIQTLDSTLETLSSIKETLPKRISRAAQAQQVAKDMSTLAP